MAADRPQTQVKLAAYSQYLPDWLRILGQSRGVHDLYVLDLFAGPGTYKDGVSGSPVIAADAALVAASDLERRGYRVRVHLRVVEKSDRTREQLRSAMSRYDGMLDYEVLGGSAEERAPSLLAESVGSPTLALLDPDGIDLPFELVRSFGNRSRTEVLLSFNVQTLLRCAEIDDGPAVSRFFADDISWRRCYGANGAIDADARVRCPLDGRDCDYQTRYS